jgi:hypothetical protein
MSQKTFAQYTMINPLITEWLHDTYDYSQGNGIMTHTMTIRYEAVKYYSGAIGGEQPSSQVPGFADPANYDTTISPIAAPGSNDQVEIQGTLRSVPQGNKQDLQALSTGQNTLQNVLGAVGQALVPTAASFLNGQLAGSGALGKAIAAGVGIAAGIGVPASIAQTPGGSGGQLFPTPNGVGDSIKNIIRTSGG